MNDCNQTRVDIPLLFLLRLAMWSKEKDSKRISDSDSNADHVFEDLFQKIKILEEDLLYSVSFFETMSAEKWTELINFAASQGVLAMSYDGLLILEKVGLNDKKNLDEGANQISMGRSSLPKNARIRWALSARKVEVRYNKHIEAIKKLVTLFKKYKIEVLLLKGAGLAQYYPISSHREWGDMDIFLFGDYERGNDIIESLGIKVVKDGSKHSHFIFEGVPVENHKTLFNLRLSKCDKYYEGVLGQILKDRGFDIMMIGEIPVRIPIPDHTAIFLVRHMIIHFFLLGIRIRHICDMALFFSENKDKIDIEALKIHLSRKKQLALFEIFLNIAQTRLGMPFLEGADSKSNERQIRLKARVYEDIIFNRFRYASNKKSGKKRLKKNVMGIWRYISNKWKYDIIDKKLFYKVLFNRTYEFFYDIGYYCKARIKKFFN